MDRKFSSVSAVACAVAMFAAADLVLAAASDSAGNAPYADGWDAGDNGGTGFGSWAFSFSGDATLLNPIYSMDPSFIDGVGLGPLAGNSLGAPAFGLTTSNRPFFFDTLEATRTINSPLAIGQTFSVDIDGSALIPAAPFDGLGNVFALHGTDNVERFGMFTFAGSNANNWIATGGNTAIPAASSFNLAFTLTGLNSYSLALTPVGGGAPLYAESGALGGTAGVGIGSIRIADYGTGSSADGSREMFLDNFSIVPEPTSLVLSAFGICTVVAAARRRRK